MSRSFKDFLAVNFNGLNFYVNPSLLCVWFINVECFSHFTIHPNFISSGMVGFLPASQGEVRARDQSPKFYNQIENVNTHKKAAGKLRIK